MSKLTYAGSQRPARMALLTSVFTLGIAAGTAQAQVASSLINEGDTIEPGQTATLIDNLAVNSIGGWSANVGTASTDYIWGSVDGISAPAVIRKEQVIDGITQTGFESRYGMSDTGSVCYSPSITGAPSGGTDAAYVDTTGVAIEGVLIASGPLAGLFWSFASAPSMTANGIYYFEGGTRTTQGGSTSARGLWGGSDAPLVYTGYELPGLPGPIDDSRTITISYKAARFGTEYILDVPLETTGTGVPTAQDVAMIISGRGLFLGGQLAQEGRPVPPAIGGIGGENWAETSFDHYGISDMGDYLIAGDTSGATATDEFVLVNGMIVRREGQVLGAFTLTGDHEASDMNINGDWAVIWDVNPGNREALIFNGQIVLLENQPVDVDGDGIVDAASFLTDFTPVSNGLAVADRDTNGDVAVYFPADVNNGFGVIEGIYRMVRPTTAGPSGDLQIAVTDSPDPQISVPGSITYTVKVRNNSGAAINSVVVTSNLDPGLTFNAGLSDPIAMHSAGTVTANLGTMAAYELRIYKFVADANNAGVYTTTSSVTGATADSVPGNNNASNDTTVVGGSADLAVTITDSPDPVTQPGGAIVYTLDVFNDGPSNATGVTVTMNLDPSTTFNAGLSDPAAMHAAGVVTINVGAVAADTHVFYNVAANVSVQGVITADAAVTGAQSDPVPDNNDDVETTLFQLTTDLAINITDDPDPVLPVGGQITYTVVVSNAGPSGATGVTASVTLDDSVTFVSADAPGIHDGSPNGGVVSFSIGAVAAGTNGLVADIVVDTSEAGRPACVGTTSGGGFETDPDPSDNSDLIHTLVIDDARGLPIGIYSNFAASPTSDVPGLPGAKFGDGADRPYRSPDGSVWVISADTNLGTAVDEVLLVGGVCSSSVVIQEGVTEVNPGEHVGLIDQELSIDDAGQIAYATDTDGATASDEVILRWDGADNLVIAREGGLSPATGGNYGATLAAANIVNDFTVWFDADTTLATATDRFLLSKNGVLIEAQEGVTAPLGQDGGATAVWQTFNTGSLRVDGTGANYIVVGDTNDADTGKDNVLVVNDQVIIQEGVIIPGSGFASPAVVSTSTESMMYGNGDWMARGSNQNGDDWVVRNAAVTARTGDPVTAASPEHYDDGSFGAGFFLFAANNAGDYILGSVTNAGETTSDALLTLNGESVISREHDPVDLDGNGQVDDGIRIHSYGNDDLILTEDLQAYFVATVRNFTGSPSDVGDVYLRLNLCGVAGPCGDLDNDKDVDADDYDAFVLAFGDSACAGDYHICADFDEDGLVTQVDYQYWLLCYRDYTGNPFATAPATIKGDFDRDNDVDLADFAAFQQCAGDGSSSVSCRARFDFDDNAVVTPADAAGFADLLVGP